MIIIDHSAMRPIKNMSSTPEKAFLRQESTYNTVIPMWRHKTLLKVPDFQ